MSYRIDQVQASQDKRDFVITIDKESALRLQNKLQHSKVYVNLVENMPYKQIENQLRLSSCVANATVSALETLARRNRINKDYSRLFVYYNIREPYPQLRDRDGGAYLSDGFKSVYYWGVCEEKLWPYNPDLVNTKPSATAYERAKEYKVKEYARIDGVGAFKSQSGIDSHLIILHLLQEGFPIAIAIHLSYRFGSMPNDFEHQLEYYQGVQGGEPFFNHAMLIVGYDSESDSYIIQNSWGREWGAEGLCVIKREVFERDVFDAWVCTKFYKFENTPYGAKIKRPLWYYLDRIKKYFKKIWLKVLFWKRKD